MDEPEQIRALQKELQQLQEQLQAQQHTIHRLHQRLMQLSGGQNQEHLQPPHPPVASGKGSLENFIGLRLIHLVGIVVLVIGLSIGVKYAIDRNLISEGMRILLAYGAGAILFFLSLQLRKKYSVFSAILFSGAMASLYFTTYAAFVYYSMMPFAAAFALMVILTIFTATQAISYNRQEIALLGLIGAYGIPFLISQNSERAHLLFLYVFIINLGVAYLCLKKEWKYTGRAAQIITWVLFIAWAATRFTSAAMGSAGLFLFLFFVLFSFIALTPIFRHRSPLTVNDGHQQWLNNLSFYFGSLFIFAPDMENQNLAVVSGMMALFIGLQLVVYYHFLKAEQYLQRLHLFLFLSLLVLFIAFRWNGFAVTLLWLLLAVVAFSAGVWAKSVPLRIAAIALMGLTLVKLLLFDSLSFSTIEKVIAYLMIGVLLLVISFFYQKYKGKLFGKE